MKEYKMNKNTFDIKDHFFIMSSDDLDKVCTKLYGYCVSEEGIICDANCLDGPDIPNNGTYIYVKRESDVIHIYQDYVGSYGLFLFESEGYWAISNSFILLVDYIKKKHVITFNKGFADQLLVIPWASISYSETLVNEIKVIDRSAVCTVDIIEKKISITLRDFHENTIELDSKEGMLILDAWYEKWCNFISALSNATRNIQMDLSGGFDSRMLLNLFLGSKINLNNICINSIDDDLYTHKEDYDIASEMAYYYGFSVNERNNLDHESMPLSCMDIMNISLYSKLGFERQMYYQNIKRNKYRIWFRGAGGETLRDSQWSDSETGCIELHKKMCKELAYIGTNLTDSIVEVLKKSYFDIRDKYLMFGRDVSPDDIGIMHYRETRNRFHFGFAAKEDYFSGNITISPLLDPDIQKLKLYTSECNDKNLLLTIMLVRYQKSLLDFKFEGSRSIDSKTVEKAIDICQRYPIIKKNEIKKFDNKLPLPVNSDQHTENEIVEVRCIREKIKNIYYSPDIMHPFVMLYSKSVYNHLSKRFSSTAFHPDSNANIVIPISKIYKDCLASESTFDLTDSIGRWLLSDTTSETVNSLYEDPYLSNYITLRVDVKNIGADSNDIQIIEKSDSNIVVESPDWLNREGNGKAYILQSCSGILKLRIKCIGSGILKIIFRGKYVKDINGKCIPFVLDITNFQLDKEILVNDDICVWHDEPYRCEKKVVDGQELSLNICWQPHKDTKHRYYVIYDSLGNAHSIKEN